MKDVCHDRPTYRHPRITAIVNRINKSRDLPRVNHKRIYRIMKEQNQLLQRNAPRLKRTHEGKIITLKSNARWCSDILRNSKDNVLFEPLKRILTAIELNLEI
ncbi:hypothetical protein [Leptospira ainazelensis]|uniref:hypothetical protein n=1 Tax=Leptospira ainazelensis TaxID=2810034 RepID=UPI0038CC180B